MRGSLRTLGFLLCLPFVLSGQSPSPQAELHSTAFVVASRITLAVKGPAGPVFDRDFPDPTVMRVGKTYYAFATQTPWESPGHVFPILVSTDLARWTYTADVFAAAPAWGLGDWWAPAPIARNGTYYVYYSGRSRSRMHCLAVATASRPAGPYTDHGPIACNDGAQARGYIDAWPLLAAGNAYLYFSVDGPDHHSISVLPMTSDMLGVAGPRAELLGVTEAWESGRNGTVEGPSVFAWGSRFVLLYSGGDWRGRYGMGYAVATSPLGPFVKSTTPLLQTGGPLSGPGGGSFFTDSNGRPWLAYHGWLGAGRVLYVSPLSIALA
ncbi:MAG TPA: family 43 glycosylhydrolase [Candidatus Dormibacteraeota bacterium]|nr:family 43 glycosylhydrolase [Candidatus Dormibacteraeota bacterium]